MRIFTLSVSSEMGVYSRKHSALLSGPGFRDLITRKSHIIRFPGALQNLIVLRTLVSGFVY